MTFLMGIDGGGTGCRAVLADAEGRVLGEGRAGPANIVTDPDGARRSILAAAEQALRGSGATLADPVAVLGLAGANIPDYVHRLAAALPFARCRIENDAVIALKGAIRDSDGVVATIGTGSVFAGQIAGKIEQIGGWGAVLGDEASGAWLGRALLSRTLHAADGLVPRTALLDALLVELGGAEGIVDFARAAPPDAFGRFAPRLFDTGDPAAEAVLAPADAWIARCIDRLAGDAGGQVTFLGGLGARFAARLAPLYGARLVPARGGALDGALLLARQEAGL
ncbi:BadF/BadG/BcrA/BcrD ATPase family protein [Acidimangrovimonas sediminis]|uniref:BadF/BadG/BcrA/BcrD ATPase family protein n=1 Tax=Acidimangrovimonas sediminis TaxID=2056283 RepID=UPI000C7FB56B|nr:BadF/BadG/BcrA/BcrD ATPase family protein [Acidimangrovimonas sediminis]